MFKVEELWVEVDGKKVVKGVNFESDKGQIHAIMGPNGSGKTSFVYAVAGHPKYKVVKGKIIWKGKDITNAKPDERAKMGIFLGFQYPYEIPGVPLGRFLWQVASKGKKFAEFSAEMKRAMSVLKLPDEFSKRDLNLGFSGGEKKRTEILQMLMLKPELVMLDEPDSGLDIDSVKMVANAINSLVDGKRVFLIITHYPRILNFVKPDKVHIMWDGKIVASGDMELARLLEREGYGSVFKKFGIDTAPQKEKGVEAKDMI